MQKIVNVLAVASSVVSLAVVGGGAFVYVQRDAIIEDIKNKALESVIGGAGVPDVGEFGGELPTGSNDLAPIAPNQAVSPAPSAPVQL